MTRESACFKIPSLPFDSPECLSVFFRFIPPADLLTRAVFVVDDDIAVPCEHLNSAFQVSQWVVCGRNERKQPSGEAHVAGICELLAELAHRKPEPAWSINQFRRHCSW